MGCRCCRMIKSYIYDPSVPVDGRKSDSAGSSLYQPHQLAGEAPGRADKHKEGFHNLGYSKSSDSSLRLEVDNNHLNQRLHAAPTRELHRTAAPPPDDRLYIIEPEWRDRGPSQVPVYPDIEEYREGTKWDTGTNGESLSADEIDEGVGGTPEYPCDTGDEGSGLSVDIHTSNTSLSSGDAADERRAASTPDVATVESGICVAKDEEGDGEGEEAESVTDSMVAEALAALEAATAGEDYE